MRKMIKVFQGNRKGITGLETAIILIAFVVVASVFAYTVLSAGIFSSQKGKEAVNSGLQQTSSTMQMVGGVVAKDTNGDNKVDQLVFTVANALSGSGIDLTTTTDSNNNGLLSDETTKNNVCIISYVDQYQTVDNIAWTKTELGKGNGNNVLDPGEKMQITVDVSHLSTALAAYHTFTLEVTPNSGSTLSIERTIPAVVDAVMDLQ
jgi:flagellin FlaB